LLLACLAYLSVALPGSTLGLLWPSIRLSLGQPVGALGILLVSGITASAIASARDINWMHASYGLGATLGPLLVTALLSAGRSWRQAYGVMALLLAALGGVLALARRGWRPPASASASDPASPPARPASVAGALTFTAVETGIESGAGIWGFLFLTAGRGLTPAGAGVAVAAYWAMMCAGRVVLGPVAERLGPPRLLAAAVAGVPLGAALMALPMPGPGSSALAVAGLMLLGLAAAPVFPLFTLATGTTRMVSLQVAASAVGGAALPAGLGLLIAAVGPLILAPSLLALGLAMAGLYAFIRRA
jgi:fucose permease